MVRQLLYGQRFFRDEFGRAVTNLWLPDVFGYSGVLPQLIRKAGCEYFMTQKLSWNSVNRHPHHTFIWQGIDGTSVLTHMLPEGTYNSAASPSAVSNTERNYLDKNVSDRALLCFGIGDGGGGPGEEHLERLSREKNLAGLPPVTQEPAERFFAALEKDREKLATWVGELYLERHQGTYTTQARSKRYNRKMEITLREAEFAAARAHAAGVATYPAKDLEQIWKEVLLYQFHDILPGSSIDRVYEESLARYALMLQQTEAITAFSNAAFYAHIDVDGLRQPMIVANTLSWPRHDFVRVGERWFGVTVPPCGYCALDAAADPVAFQASTATEDRLENEYLLIRLHPDGSLAQVLDKRRGRDVLTADGNRLAVYEDPGDAWDFPMDYDTRPPQYFRLQSASAAVEGPRAVLRQVYTYGESTLTQQITLTAGSSRLDFITRVDWRERNKMLRTSFPVAVQASEATCEIQYGYIKRPTHRNTSWDVAKYEVCAQRWVDLSTVDYVVALLNDCKYGHKLLGNVLDLNLLRSPSAPGKHADLAEHEFTYSLYPHDGDCVRGEVMRAAAELNMPLRIDAIDAHTGTLAASASLLRIDTPNIVLDALKKAEDSDDLILRFYDASGAGARATITIGPHISAACTVNLLEEDAQTVAITDNTVVLDFHPFEVITLQITG